MDSDSDSNRSQEMFSDDELIASDYGRDSTKTDISFVSCSQSSISNGSTPTKKEICGSAAIPKTPLSLGPFISKAEVWTRDLETPESKKPIQYGSFSAERIDDQIDLRITDQRPINTNATPPTILDTLTADEIIPASQTTSMDNNRRRVNGRILKYVSNDSITTSDFDNKVQATNILHIIDKSHSDRYVDSVIQYNPIGEFATDSAKMRESSIDTHSKQLDRLNSVTLARRVKQLKKLQNKCMKNTNYGCIPNGEFAKTLKNLAYVQNFIGDPKVQTEWLHYNHLGFIPFSQISINFDDKVVYETNKNCTDIQDRNFHGFSRKSQNNSRIYCVKFFTFLHERTWQTLNNSSKYCQNFLGFTTHENEQSSHIARIYKFMYDKYLDCNHRLSKRPIIKFTHPNSRNNGGISPLSLTVNTGVKTAHGNDIFLDVDIIYRSKSLFLDAEYDLFGRNIDELVKNINSSPLKHNPEIKMNLTQNITKDVKQCVHSNNAYADDVKPNCMNFHHNFNNSSFIMPKLQDEIINDQHATEIIEGFKTARGACVRISDQALLQANRMLNTENDINIDKQAKTNVMAKSKMIVQNNDVVSKHYYKFDAVHNTATKKISNDALSHARVLFQDENALLPTNLKVDPSTMGFQTGHGKRINISEDAFLKAKVTFAEDIKNDTCPVKTCIPFHNIENSIRSSDTVQNIATNKRKHRMDDDTPVGRKKIRIGTDLQRRKLFCEIEEEDHYLADCVLGFNNENCVKIDRNIECLPIQRKKSTNNIDITTNSSNNANIISDEVRESIAALLKDEENCNGISDQWANNFSTNMTSSKNRRSYGLHWHKCNKNLEKRSRSYPGSGGESGNKASDAIDTKTSVNAKLSAKHASPKNEDIPEDIYFDSPYSEEVIDARTIDHNRQKRSAAIITQQTVIESKKTRQVCPVIQGSLLYLKETNDCISLKHLFKNGIPVVRTREQLSNANIDACVLSINSVTAIDYQFRCVDFFGKAFMDSHYDGIPIADDALLIPNNDNLAGIKEFEQCFLASPGVDPSLVPNGYVKNHYRWIVWKLASMDRLKVDELISGKFLTPDRVMGQLKYRYDREIDRSQRSALRKILEKDDAPSRRLVLCVSQIFAVDNDDSASVINNHQRTIEMTDGWYSVYVSIDYAMLDNIKRGKVQVGTKLMIYGAELVNLNEGRHPLEISNDVRLKIHTNSTRRAKWYTKLGYQRESGPMKCFLKSINPNGGLIGKFTVGVARVYPIIYREKIGDGQFVDRNARCEEKISIAYEAECQSRIEAVCANTEEGIGEKWKIEMENRVLNNLPVRRDVTPIAKIKVADRDCTGLITLWSGAEESQNVFKENTCITIRSALASGKKLNELQITANRYTIFEKVQLTTKTTTPISIMCPKRIFTSLDETYRPGFNPYYGEFDTVGVIVSIGPAPHGMKNFDTVNLAFKNDESEEASSFYLSILFWQGISSYGLLEIATVGSFVACSNLEWRKNTYKSIPTAFYTDRTLLTRNPQQYHLRQPFNDLRARIKNPEIYATTCALKIQTEISKKGKSLLVPTDDNNTPWSESRNTICPQNKMQYSSNNRSSSSNNNNSNKNLVTPHSTLKINSRSVAVKKRIEKLRNYGPAPLLSPIHLTQTPKNALGYRSPISPSTSLILHPH